jgi:hypothetical protein
MSQASGPRVAVVLKGWPRLSETFIAQEIAGLEARGVALEIWSLRRPTDESRHPVHDRVAGRVVYLPEYLKDDPSRVARGWLKARRLPGYAAARAKFVADLRRDPTSNRMRRWGQALVLAAEMPESVERLYAHFLHTPASVTRYAAIMRGLPWSVSAHAKDIWTSEPWEIASKLADCAWLTTCTAVGLQRLRELAPRPERLQLVYHGLDFAHLPPPPAARPLRDGSDPADPVVILSIGLWLGAQPQKAVFAALARADLFVLASRKAADGDQDGLPNVLMEAAYQGLPIVSTRAAAIGEFIEDGTNGLLAAPGAPDELALAIERLVRDPRLRRRFADAAGHTVRTRFSYEAGVDWIAAALGQPPATARAAE